MAKVTRATPLFLLPGLQKVVPTSLYLVAHPLSDFLDITGTFGWCTLYPKLPFLSGCSLLVLPGTGLGLPGTSHRWEGVGTIQAASGGELSSAAQSCLSPVGGQQAPQPALSC